MCCYMACCSMVESFSVSFYSLHQNMDMKMILTLNEWLCTWYVTAVTPSKSEHGYGCLYDTISVTHIEIQSDQQLARERFWIFDICMCVAEVTSDTRVRQHEFTTLKRGVKNRGVTWTLQVADRVTAWRRAFPTLKETDTPHVMYSHE